MSLCNFGFSFGFLGGFDFEVLNSPTRREKLKKEKGIKG
jgi:hypothetical protein